MKKENFVIELVKGKIDVRKKLETFIWLPDWHEDGQSYQDLQRGENALRFIHKHPDWRTFLGGDQIDCAQLSNLPTQHKPKSIEENLIGFGKHFKPLYPQIEGMVQGNHENRLFRCSLGKGMLPDLVTGHYSIKADIQTKNPNLIFAEIDRGIHLDLETREGTLHWLLAHGRKAGMSADSEFSEQLKIYRDLDASFLGHTQAPSLKPLTQMNSDGKVTDIWAVRGSAFTSFPPYAEARNLPPCPLGFWKIELINGKMQQPQFMKA
jgi:hypothetical protein